MKWLMLIFFLGITTLLIGGRFNFTWAGGTGYEKAMPATVEIYSDNNIKNKTAVERGYLIKTNTGETAIVSIGEKIFLAVDERSDVVLEKLFPSEIKLTLRGGRLLAQTSDETEKLTVAAPEDTDSITSGLITAVRYDALKRTDIVPFDNFDWSNSSDRDFFLWAADLMEIKLSEP